MGHRMHRQHMVAAMLAAALSVVAHLAFMVNVTHLPMQFSYVLEAVHRAEPRQALQLRSVEHELPSPASRL